MSGHWMKSAGSRDIGRSDKSIGSAEVERPAADGTGQAGRVDNRVAGTSQHSLLAAFVAAAIAWA